MFNKIKRAVNALRIKLHDRKETKFTKEFHRQLENLRHYKMLEEAEALVSRPSYKPAEAVELEKVA